MNFEEHAGKVLLRAAGIATPRGGLATSPDQAARIAGDLGPCVVKAQVPAGKRGKAGGIRLAATSEDARTAATAILALTIGEYRVERLLVEQQAPIAHEMYAAILNDPGSQGPLALFAAEGGMDIEELAQARPASLMRFPIDIREGLDPAAFDAALPASLPAPRADIVRLFQQLYAVYAGNDAELVEINPLVVTNDGRLLALDCKFTLDDAAIPRREALAKSGTPDKLTEIPVNGSILSLRESARLR